MIAGRLAVLRTSAGVLIFCLLIVCFNYQILGKAGGRSLLVLARRQRLGRVSAGIPRGNILDRYGVPLHDPEWGVACVAFPEFGSDREKVAKALEQVLGKERVLLEGDRWSGGVPVRIAGDLSSKTVQALIALNRGGLEGVYVVPEERRYGPESLARHVVGYVPRNAYFDSADNVGQLGLERYLDGTLKGGDASWVGVVLAGDRSVFPGSSVRIGPGLQPPEDVRTTIDACIQRIVERAMDAAGISKGAAVVLDVDTGEVLAMASRPDFRQDKPEASIGLPDAPFVNRAVSAFIPGSVYKTVIVAAALESGAVEPHQRFQCNGSIKVGDREIRCTRAHGEITLEEALGYSCNCALIEIALKTGPEKLLEFSKRAGFGKPTGIELPEESSGYLPEAGEMLAGDVANLAIGQGYLGVTPLQMAVFFRAIISGELGRPTLLIPNGGKDLEAKVGSPGAQTPARSPVRSSGTTIMSRETSELLRKSLLFGTTTGTGQPAWVPRLGSAGKTGTAEAGEGRLPHAWFVGFCPLVSPKYVICVFAENGGEGPAVAAPLFREIALKILAR